MVLLPVRLVLKLHVPYVDCQCGLVLLNVPKSIILSVVLVAWEYGHAIEHDISRSYGGSFLVKEATLTKGARRDVGV